MLKHWVDASHNSEHFARLSTEPGEFGKRPEVAGSHDLSNTVSARVLVVLAIVFVVVVVVVVVVLAGTVLSNIPNEAALSVAWVFVHAVLK